LLAGLARSRRPVLRGAFARRPGRKVFLTTTNDNSARRRAGLSSAARLLLCGGLLLWGGGCGVFRQEKAGGAGEDSLEAALAGLVPVPFGETGGAPGDEDRAAAAIAAAAAGWDGTARFSPDGDPLLRPGLVVKVAVMVGDKVEVKETSVQVSDKGDITLPMVGKVPCDGLTIAALRDRLTELYGAFYREPSVTVDFVYDERGDSPWGKVLVLGRVRTEGWVNIPPTRDMTVSRAIQLAGGFNTSARKNAISVKRRLPDGTAKHFRVDLLAVGKHGEIEQDIALEPGDIVYVPESPY
jgi:protein involved in polysaccharide export with SLBB domain